MERGDQSVNYVYHKIVMTVYNREEKGFNTVSTSQKDPDTPLSRNEILMPQLRTNVGQVTLDGDLCYGRNVYSKYHS
jgi:hypothetical protein